MSHILEGSLIGCELPTIMCPCGPKTIMGIISRRSDCHGFAGRPLRRDGVTRGVVAPLLGCSGGRMADILLRTVRGGLRRCGVRARVGRLRRWGVRSCAEVVRVRSRAEVVRVSPLAPVLGWASRAGATFVADRRDSMSCKASSAAAWLRWWRGSQVGSSYPVHLTLKSKLPSRWRRKSRTLSMSKELEELWFRPRLVE